MICLKKLKFKDIYFKEFLDKFKNKEIYNLEINFDSRDKILKIIELLNLKLIEIDYDMDKNKGLEEQFSQKIIYINILNKDVKKQNFEIANKIGKYLFF